MALADVTVARCLRPADATANTPLDEYDIDMDQTWITRTHLGALLKEGDYAQGYHLQSANFNSQLLDDLQQATANAGGSHYHEVPDVVLLRKVFPGRRSRGKQRYWRVKRITDEMAVEQQDGDEDERGGAGGKSAGNSKQRGVEQERRELEWEGFMRELEDDKDLRDMVNLYRGTCLFAYIF